MRDLQPERRRRAAATDALRARVEQRLDMLSRDSTARFESTVLVDGMWDNPNYWVRYAMLRSALGLSASHEVGVTGPFAAAAAARSFKRFGISATVSYQHRVDANRPAAARIAAELIKTTRRSDDVLAWQLPFDLPAGLIYDAILKRQRSAQVEVDDSRFLSLTTQSIAEILAARDTLDEIRPSLIVLSHAVNASYGSLAWLAMQRGIPTLVIFGQYGMPRFFKLVAAEDLYDWNNGPSLVELDALAPERRAALAEAGREHLRHRMSGRTDDLGAMQAFRRAQSRVDRAALAATFGWDPARPIIAVYASNWFDYPHGFGMTAFRDALDWLGVTLEAARRNDGVNWLFKPHPCDSWYGGITLSDLVDDDRPPHVAIAPESWNGEALMEAVDGLVTCHSTGGVEYASRGKPVLLPDRGWYHQAGFAVMAQGRDDYVRKLGSTWWTTHDPVAVAERAAAFAGAYFCAPDWQKHILLGDDSEQALLYPGLARMLEMNHPDSVTEWRREIALIRDWFESPSRRYYVYRILGADSFKPSNMISSQPN
jgi:hypothetical protein